MSLKNHYIKMRMIQSARGENYTRHYAARALIKELPIDQVEILAQTADSILPFPLLNIYGASYDGWMPANVRKIIARHWAENLAGLFNPWYLSESGWSGFQHLWKALPEPEDIPNLWITTPQPVDKSVDKLWTTCGNHVENLLVYPQAKYQISGFVDLSKKLSTGC